MARLNIRIAELRSVVNDWREDLFTIRGAISVASWCAVLMAVIFALLIGRDIRRAERFAIPHIQIDNGTPTQRKTRNSSVQQFQVITNRDLFQTRGTAPVQAAQTNSPQLKMRLVGTSLGPSGPIAILEDLNKNEQDVFGPNESIFGRARLIEVGQESIKVDFNGRQELLEIEEGTGDSTAKASPGDDQTDFTIPEAELNDALSNLPLLLSQARADPYFRNGQSVGMRLFAIRKESMYEKLGLKNGDILLAVNEHNLNDPSQALKIFEQLRNERSINIKLERNGQSKDMNYSIR